MNDLAEKGRVELERRVLILEEAIRLFALSGFDGVSMRDIAKATGITPAALYHHFDSKQELHAAALRHAYRGRERPATEMLLPASVAPEARLRNFVRRLCQRFHEDVEFRLLLQRERLNFATDADHVLVAEVFKEPVTGLQELMAELAPGFDKHLLANAVFGLVIHLYETEERRRHLPGYKPEHDDPEVASEHILKLLMQGILPRD